MGLRAVGGYALVQPSILKDQMSKGDSLYYVLRAKKGDRGAWEELYKRYFPRWYERLHGRLGVDLRSVYDTEDLVQSALADAIRDIKGLRSEAAFWVWVTAIAQRKLLQKTRKPQGRALQVRISDLDDLAHANGDPVSTLEREEQSLKIYDALLELFPYYPRQMSAIYLHYFAGKKISEIASLFGLSDRSAERLLSSGKKLLASKLPPA